MEHESIVQMGSARMLPGYMYCKTFMVNKGTGAGVYRWGSRRGHSFILGLYTTIFQADIYAIKACIMENIEEATQVGTSIFFLTVKHSSRPSTAAR